ncbi:MAG: hypothetical protein A2085_05165 [Gemmatimonadetes bacterium GWC2_71_10]|nr:MAG: hypothetical protein A2085_05165 [Gemmatimonadetes bacterium GWC2_71_10]
MTVAAMPLALRVALLVGVALLAFGLGALLVRRSLLGALTGFLLGVGGAVLLAVALLGQTGRNAALGHVVGVAAALVAVAISVAAIALHLAAARAARREGRLEPW